MGFLVSPLNKICQNIEEVWKLLQEKEKEQLEFACDGIVIKLNNYSFHSQVGRTSRFPHWAIAFKFASPMAYTQLLSIKNEVSKNGRISYIAELKPIEIMGSVIKKVTLLNYSFIKEKK